jgi:hypothetical protein
MANDVTDRGQEWYPQIIRLYPDSDKRYDPKTMGFMYHPGYYGERGVGAVTNQGWFMNVKGDRGRDYSTRAFCENPPHVNELENFATLGLTTAPYEACIISKIPFAGRHDQ